MTQNRTPRVPGIPPRRVIAPRLFAVAAVLHGAAATAASNECASPELAAAVARAHSPAGAPAPANAPAPTPLNDTDLVGGFDGLAVTTTGKSSLATAPIAVALAPVGSGNRWYNAIGVDVSTSLPVESATFADYGRQQLLTRKGGLLNVYFSFTGRNADDNCELSAFRRSLVNRVYLGSDMIGATRARLFVSQGVGARVIKTELPGNATGGMFTGYAGFGVDGPLFNGNAESFTSRNAAGLYSLETYASYNLLNKRTLAKMFPDEAPSRGFATVGARFLINLPGDFNLHLEYGKGMGSFGRKALGDVVMLSFGYRREATPTQSAKAAAKENGTQ